MPTALLHRRANAGQISTVDVDARTVTVRLCRWDTVSEPVPADAVTNTAGPYREVIRRGAVELAADVHVTDAHYGTLIGRAVPESLTDDGDGPTVDLLIAPTAAGSDLLTLVDTGVIRSVSMEFEPIAGGHTVTGTGLVERTAVRVQGVAFAFRPGHDAPITHIREQENPAMPNPTVMPDTPPVAVPAEPAAGVTPDVLTRSLDEIRLEVADLVTRAADPAGQVHELAQFRTFGDYFLARAADPSVPVLTRALVDQITDNNAGVLPPTWLTTIAGIVTRTRPAVTRFGVESLMETGMSIEYPFYAGDITALVGEQAAEKTEITSVLVDIERGTAGIRTFAGGSDISYQLIRRSSPAYLNAYMAIMFNGYAATTEAAHTLATEQAATASVYDVAADTDGTALKAWVGGASVAVETATGAPAAFVLAATDVFTKMVSVLPSAPYGTFNQPGAGNAATLQVGIHGLPLVHAPYMTAGSVVASNDLAGSWHEDGPMTVTEEDVAKLGQNVAVWGMGTSVIALPAGVQLGNAGGAAPAAAQRAKSKK